ncbi:MAG: hypothetical protein R3F20_18970 [Planctomycetota bacterium]
MKRLHLLLLASAFALFFAPWTTLFFEGPAGVWQTGFQRTAARETVDPDFDWEIAGFGTAFRRPQDVHARLRKHREFASDAPQLRVILALIAVSFGLLAAARRIHPRNDRLGHPAIYAGLAFVLLVVDEALRVDLVERVRYRWAWSRSARGGFDSASGGGDFGFGPFEPRYPTVWFLLELLVLAVVVGLAVADRIFARWTTRLAALERDPGVTEDVAAAVAARARADENRLDASRDSRSPS